MSKETESVIKYSPTNKSPGPDGFPVNSSELLMNLCQFFSNSSRKLQRREDSQTHFKTSITVISKPEKDFKKENDKTIFQINIDADLFKTIVTNHI